MGNISKTNLFSIGKGSISNPLYQSDNKKHSSAEAGYRAAKLRRMVSSAKKAPSDKKTHQSTSSISVYNPAYTDSLREARAKKKDTGLSMKRLQYNFKKVSSDIMSSKTSSAAKAAAGKARREVLRLKRLKASGEYDAEEIEAAITHAKSMERIAKKKAAHLEQEEMIKVTDKNDASLSLGEALKAEDGNNMSEDTDQELSDETGGNISAENETSNETMQEDLVSEISVQTEELMTQLQDEMQEILEEAGLPELISGPVGKMSSDDFEMLKTKHRTDEMKEIAKADKEYLKVVFDKLQAPGGSIDVSV